MSKTVSCRLLEHSVTSRLNEFKESDLRESKPRSVIRHAVDEGLMKCALQQFQHTHPQLTSRITEQHSSQSQPNLDPNSERSFVAMELPKFPLDSEFAVRDMLHERFSACEGPLWRVQLITEATMDRAGLGEW